MSGFPSDPTAVEFGAAFGANLSTPLASLTYTPLTPTYVKPYVVITRGRIGGAGRAQPTQIDFGLKNPSGIFSPRNVAGPHYGSLRQNTPVRMRLDPGSGYVTRAIAYNPAWPVRWTGPDIDDRIETTALGALSQLGQGGGARSAAERTMAGYSPTEYWPLDDGSNAASFRSVVAGHQPVPVDPSLIIPGGTTGPNGVGQYAQTTTTGNDSFQLKSGLFLTSYAYDALVMTTVPDGSNFLIIGIASILADRWNGGAWHHLRATFVQSGADVNYELFADGVLGTSGTFVGATLNSFPADFWAFTNVATSVGQVILWPTNTPALSAADASSMMFGYNGETVDARFARLCTEDGIADDIAGTSGERMGPQPTANIVDLLRECEATAEGVMLERRTGELGLDLLSARYNQAVALTLAYGTQVADLQPGDDDRDTINYAEITRAGGSSRIVEVTTGPLGTDDSTGVGKYDGSTTRSLYTDDQAADHAGWITFVGTVDEQRQYVTLNLRANPGLITQWLACDIGSRVQITSPPQTNTGPGPLDLIIEGYRETIDGVEWTVEMWLEPYSPYHVGELATTSGDTNPDLGWLDWDSCVLQTDITSGATSWTVAAFPNDATAADDFPRDQFVGGELVTVTASALVTDVFTRSVSNGWGTSTSGHAWTIAGGSASDYSVASNAGKQSHSDVNVIRRSILPVGGAYFDFTVDVSLAIGAALGASVTQWICGRLTDNNNYYAARLDLTTTNQIQLFIGVRAAGTFTSLTTAITLATSHAGGDVWRVRFQGERTTLRAKAWISSGSEPKYWHAVVVDGSLTTGTSIGLISRLETGNTNTTPVVFTWDNLSVTSAYNWTATRSVNGIAKAHTADDAFTLADPIILAL